MVAIVRCHECMMAMTLAKIGDRILCPNGHIIELTEAPCDDYRDSHSDEDHYPFCWRCGYERTDHV